MDLGLVFSAMRRSWEKLFVVWVLGVSLVGSTRLQGATTSFQHRLQGAAPQYASSRCTTSWEVGRPKVPTSDASTAGRSLLDLETSTDGPKNPHISKKWLIIIIIIVVMSTTTVIAIAIAIFLLRNCLRRGHKRKNRKSNRMLVWTNQLSSLQHHEFSGSENNSRRGSARLLDLPAKGLPGAPAPWLSGERGPSVAAAAAVVVPCSVSYALLQAATQNFSSSNLLGEGSFGLVYKAEMVDWDGKAAVKRLCGGAGSKHCRHKEFQGEVDLMSKIRHPNLVALLGYSSDGPEPLVVYELMPNGSLHDQLHGPSCGTALAWHLRLKIALEAARGLEHLHESCKPPIIHRDFKASNILLDASFNAKISDFGLAIALEGGVFKEDVQVQGTFGYIAPEYLMDGMLTEKSDVYGFGVVLLELLTGKLPIDSSLPLGSQSLVTWVTPLLQNRAKLMEILDPSLQDSVNEKHLHQVAAVAVLCVQAEPSYRPLIADVVQSLLPLVPQELGGVWRDPKTKPCLDNASSKKLDCEALEVELQSFHSQRSDYSVISVEHFPKSSILDSSHSLGRTRSWENVTTSYLEQHCEGQGT